MLTRAVLIWTELNLSKAKVKVVKTNLNRTNLNFNHTKLI